MCDVEILAAWKTAPDADTPMNEFRISLQRCLGHGHFYLESLSSQLGNVSWEQVKTLEQFTPEYESLCRLKFQAFITVMRERGMELAPYDGSDFL